ncbi:MAG: hypothetical protein L0Y56_15365 [Nitrospira sp.]|nr:hypothetical protein [Nitrospira sp.]
MGVLLRVEMFTISDSLKAVLSQADCGAVTSVDHRGRVHVFVKSLHQDMGLLEGPLPIFQSLFMLPMPTAPVVVWIIEIMGNPQNPLRADIFFNVMNSSQAENLRCLSRQRIVPLHFVRIDHLSVVATKWITPPRDTDMVYKEAVVYAHRIPPCQYDFDGAKAAFRAGYPLSDIDLWWLT